MNGDIEHDVAKILEKRHHKEGDFWATPDGRISSVGTASRRTTG